MARITAADLTQRLTFQRDLTERSDSGARRPWTTPQDVCTVWGKLDPVAGKEEYSAARQTVSRGTYLAHILWRDDIDEKMRIKLAHRSGDEALTRYFSVRHVPAVERREVLMAVTVEEVK